MAIHRMFVAPRAVSRKIKGLRERNKETKLARIERAARKLFSEQGYEETTTREIAARAGIGTGTLFVYFPEKRDLLFHLFRADVVGIKDAAFASAPRGNLVDRLMSVFTRFFDYYARDPRLSRIFVKELPFMEDADRSKSGALILELLTALAGLVAEAQRAGEIDRSIPPMAAAYQIFAAYFTVLVGWLGGAVPEREPQLAILRGGLELLYRGLAARKPAS